MSYKNRPFAALVLQKSYKNTPLSYKNRGLSYKNRVMFYTCPTKSYKPHLTCPTSAPYKLENKERGILYVYIFISISI